MVILRFATERARMVGEVAMKRPPAHMKLSRVHCGSDFRCIRESFPSCGGGLPRLNTRLLSHRAREILKRAADDVTTATLRQHRSLCSPKTCCFDSSHDTCQCAEFMNHLTELPRIRRTHSIENLPESSRPQPPRESRQKNNNNAAHALHDVKGILNL